MEQSIKNKVERAAQKWIDENLTDEAIESYVEAILNKQRDEIIAQLLGFSIEWGNKWRINNANGNAEKYAAGAFIQEKVRGAVNAWLEKSAAELPKLDKSAIASLRKAYKERYKDTLRGRLERMAEHDADDDVDSIIGVIVERMP